MSRRWLIANAFCWGAVAGATLAVNVLLRLQLREELERIRLTAARLAF